MVVIQVLETIKQRFPDTEVIVATALGEMETAIRALQLDASDFITKPIHTSALMVALNRTRHRYRTRQRLKAYTRQLESGLSCTRQQLQETVAYQQRLIESSLDGILSCDQNGSGWSTTAIDRLLGIVSYGLASISRFNLVDHVQGKAHADAKAQHI